MSEEDEDEGGTAIQCRRPNWRSDELNSLIDNFDKKGLYFI